MLALGEKTRTVVLISPGVLLEGKAEEIAATLEGNYLEVKAKKQMYLSPTHVTSFFGYLPKESLDAATDAWTKGLSEVLIVEHLDGDVISRMSELVSGTFAAAYGEGGVYSSAGPWESLRDMEFFFPHLDAMPVERTLAIVKPDGLMKGLMGGKSLEQTIQEGISAAGLFIVGKKHMVLTDAQAQVLCEDVKGTEDHKGAIGVLMQAGVVAMCVEGRGAIGKLLLLCGPAHAGYSKEVAPTTFRAQWGTDSTSNAVHASSSLEAAERELSCLFPEGSLQLQRTLCMVKPHAMSDMLPIKAAIQDAGFTVLKEKHTVLTLARAKEFYQALSEDELDAKAEESSAGTSCVLVLCRLEAVSIWQQLMGPESGAKALSPFSVRARFGDSVYGSASAKSAARDVRFFFPEMGADPVPGEEDIRDFLFRKSAAASMELKNMSSVESTDYTVDPTLMQLISDGLLSLCKARPKGLQAVDWFRTWLLENNPNNVSAEKISFSPPARTKRYVENGVNEDGLPYSVEAPPPKDVAADGAGDEQDAATDFATPPFVVFVLGDPTPCKRLSDELNLVYLDAVAMLQEEVAAETWVGSLIAEHFEKKETVPDSVIIKMLKEAMKKNIDTNRFLISGFPCTAEQAVMFEQEVAPIAFAIHLAAGETATGVQQVVEYYSPIGKARVVEAKEDAEAMYAEVKALFNCRFLYLCGPPGTPLATVASRLETKYGYSAIDVTALLASFAETDEPDAAKVKTAMAKGKPVDASIACPLVLAEIYRDLALGVHNFVICDFPQTLKQLEFLEYRIPCTSKPLLLDLTRADAEDVLATMSSGGPYAAQAEAKLAAFFASEMQVTLKSLPGLVKVPISLAEIEGRNFGAGPSTAEGLGEQLVDAVWAKVGETVAPGLTLCVGLPCSGTDVLAPLVAGMAHNTCAIDCAQLCAKEAERRTDIGLKMQAMMSEGEAIPLSMTIELLKDVLNLTCSDNVVVENCPLDAAQIGQLSSEFRIDKVLHVSGTDAANAAFKEEFFGKCKGDGAKEEFAMQQEKLAGVVAHFSRLGKVDRLEVSEKPTKETLQALIDQATMPSFVVVTGLSTQVTPKLAGLIASYAGAPDAVTVDAVPLAETPADTCARLKKFADASKSSLLILDRYLLGEEMAAEFVGMFGAPKLVVDVTCPKEFTDAEFAAAHEDMDEEAQAAAIEKDGLANEGALKAFGELCPAVIMKLDMAAMKASPEEPLKVAGEMMDIVKGKLLPKVYVILAPQGKADFAGAVATRICTAAKEGARPAKLIAVDTAELFKPGTHGPAIEEALHRGASTSASRDCVPAQLWVNMFSEAFAMSASPMGPFVITGFPSASAKIGGATISDQLCLLERVAILGGVLNVRLSSESFASCVSKDAAEWGAFSSLDSEVQDHIQKQFDKELICECSIDKPCSTEAAAAKVCKEFLESLSK